MKVSICIPYLRRKGMKNCIKLAVENAGIPAEYIEVLTEYDKDKTGCPSTLKRIVNRSTGDVVAFLADDCSPEPNWLKNALKAMESLPDGWGVVGLYIGGKSDRAGHFIADKRMLPLLDGEFFHTGYQHSYCDNELTDRAKELGRFAFAKDADVGHDYTVDQIKLDVYKEEVVLKDQLLYFRRKRERGSRKFAIGFPLVDDKVYATFFYSFCLLNTPDHWTLLFTDFPSQDIAAIRNNIVLKAIQDGVTDLLMMDTDQVYHAQDMIERLLKHDKPIVATKICRRYPPFDPLLFRGTIGKYLRVPLDEIRAGGLVEVDAVGAGCMLIQIDKLLETTYPWFEITTGKDGKPVGEDFNFCSKMREAGHEIHVDCDIEIGHISLHLVNMATHDLHNAVFKKKEV